MPRWLRPYGQASNQLHVFFSNVPLSRCAQSVIDAGINLF